MSCLLTVLFIYCKTANKEHVYVDFYHLKICHQKASIWSGIPYIGIQLTDQNQQRIRPARDRSGLVPSLSAPFSALTQLVAY